MKIKINNFGPIKSYEFDSETNLTLIFGKNNIGKSYVLSAIYLIIRTTLNMAYLPRRSTFSFALESEKLDLENIIKELEDNKNVNIDLILKALVLEKLNENFISELQEAFVGTFDSLMNLQNQFTKEKMNIKIFTDEVSFEISLNENGKLEAKHIKFLEETFVAKKVQRKMNPKWNKGIVTIYYPEGNEDFFEEGILHILGFIEHAIYHSVQRGIKSVHYLPASRSGLYQALSAFGQIIAQLSKSKNFLNKKIELPSISEPLSDYFLELSNIRKTSSEENNPTVKLAEEIEKKILHGSVDYDTKTNKIIFMPENTRLTLDLSGTSSMVSELSPIVSYLKYILPATSNVRGINPRRKKLLDTKKSLVFIEEPEAHLHPEVQVHMMEIFAKLVKNNVKMIITSHSNYMFNKTNNLILNKDIDINEVSAQILELTNKGSIGKDLHINKLGIDDENFIDIAEQLFNEKMEFIDLMNKR